ncbi:MULTISPECIES: type II toxin-antitoxin system YafQ family toxin [Leptospira]|uniref:Type II toxin-antitoxin system YafQ family toxin n=1 Tax=Leptospira montravelensis TaxID=2484961 RepID=A0ABY2LL70_9LEPT|nr:MULTISPECIES: type II toxin-antitoxin system YafQ family toxin [Leptospira]MCG6154018.1 type II toxin-antitoxin system YafQ family toxin [Leptospira bandrabouensis]MCT8335635.1 type II toxin-antitoxin system YafQ family toxin [Leptospira sp. 85282-16]PJZ87229.1 type II toxin-antitoxin system mRNA interferase toxin, RelE/StbE family [Leptospira levettii]TGK86192.1 type II toxin-antitoxin system YafQ family toxin [Leptospira montravelensis]TGK95070.1 type II toxin-antitoxin system YafQ family
MKFIPSYTNQFNKDIKLQKKRKKDLTKLKEIMSQLIDGTPLSAKHKDHKLVGNYKNRKECHIEPDWLLIYKLDQNSIIFERTGTHADLFE